MFGGDLMKNKIILVIVALLAAAGGFFGGMKYQESRRPEFFRQSGNMQPGRNGRSSQFRSGSGFRPVAGEVINYDGTTLTVKLADGSGRNVLLSGKTEISATATASAGDIRLGSRIAAFGTENSDGSITAQNIQINPAAGMRPAGQ
ncbi:hypothetical protein A2Z33_06385 [Candidatus Gottesmanbacteria bacterium RBG_16_52_11]|uniref:Uncharacterized protein n=1 Tax=Candidatus Gottesmanbacteria bacterium RBG_16_52_11 TaxID=1798374 RepID=A0A1F5YXH3_9BACT|nr:MAG: hypothetical protein A2Z33_06385 [Candidatus Gottesmanbacteria bacterium RBG_16_52_11]